jgi:hypothetical protein
MSCPWWVFCAVHRAVLAAGGHEFGLLFDEVAFGGVAAEAGGA